MTSNDDFATDKGEAPSRVCRAIGTAVALISLSACHPNAVQPAYSYDSKINEFDEVKYSVASRSFSTSDIERGTHMATSFECAAKQTKGGDRLLYARFSIRDTDGSIAHGFQGIRFRVGSGAPFDGNPEFYDSKSGDYVIPISMIASHGDLSQIDSMMVRIITRGDVSDADFIRHFDVKIPMNDQNLKRVFSDCS